MVTKEKNTIWKENVRRYRILSILIIRGNGDDTECSEKATPPKKQNDTDDSYVVN